MWYFMLQSGVHATIAGILLAVAVPFNQSDAKNPSYKLQHFLHKPVAFIILPIFALANTGIILQSGWLQKMTDSNNMGILLGLLIGKPLGILLFCWLLIKLKMASLPQQVGWKLLAGAGILAGIGFTMSIFISNLAFTESELVQYSKIAVLLASLIATLVGLLILFTAKKIEPEEFEE
jgi:NhaA family Na+:H+ antiporter